MFLGSNLNCSFRSIRYTSRKGTDYLWSKRLTSQLSTTNFNYTIGRTDWWRDYIHRTEQIAIRVALLFDSLLRLSARELL